MNQVPDTPVFEGPPQDGAACDLLVIGSGASGFAAAVTGQALGLKVMMVEKAPTFGGSTVSSAGVIWIPSSRQAQAEGIVDAPDQVLAYLKAEGGNRLDLAKAEVYASRASRILEWFETHTHVDYALAKAWPDYHPLQPGGSLGGRSLGPRPFDGRTLGRNFARLRPPLATTMILGGMIVGREDLVHFYGMTRSLTAARHVFSRFARYAVDRVTHPRGTRLSNGSALIGMLSRTAFENGVALHLRSPLEELIIEGGRVVGARIAGRAVYARSGVVLATGGFPANGAMRNQFYEHVGLGKSHRSLAPEDNTGDGIQAAAGAGAALVTDQKHAAAWTPVSLVPQADGTKLPFPHFFDRGKAGYIAVLKNGRRFTSEAISYHDFVPAMIEACRDQPDVFCYLICDSVAIRRYGLGMAPPAPGQVGPHVRSGYLVRGATIEELARKCEIDPAELGRTIEEFNQGAETGEDRQFNKGSNVYERFNGSAGQQPNPCVAPVSKGPFYAVRLYPGDIGTFNGIRTDASCKALRPDGLPIDGLYVVGNDAASFMGGSYPGAGITLGPALVFGHLAAHDAAGLSPP